MKGRNKFLIPSLFLLATVSTVVSGWLAFQYKYYRIFFCDIWYNRELLEFMVERLESGERDNLILPDDTMIFEELSIPSLMYLSEMQREAFASPHLYWVVRDYFKSFDDDIPEITFRYLFDRLNKEVEYQPTSWDPEIPARDLCLSVLASIYEEGEYVPRDSVKAEQYRNQYVK